MRHPRAVLLFALLCISAAGLCSCQVVRRLRSLRAGDGLPTLTAPPAQLTPTLRTATPTRRVSPTATTAPAEPTLPSDAETSTAAAPTSGAYPGPGEALPIPTQLPPGEYLTPGLPSPTGLPVGIYPAPGESSTQPAAAPQPPASPTSGANIYPPPGQDPAVPTSPSGAVSSPTATAAGGIYPAPGGVLLTPVLPQATPLGVATATLRPFPSPTASSSEAATPSPSPTPPPSSTPTLPPPLTPISGYLRATDPAQVKLASGKIQLVVFFAYWDSKSKAMAAPLLDLQSRYQDRMNFIFLDIDNPAVTPLKKALRYFVQPHFFLLDPQGRVIRQWQGFVRASDLEAAILAALQS